MTRHTYRCGRAPSAFKAAHLQQEATFRAERVSLQVEGSSSERHLLEDDAEAVDVSFLGSLRRRTLHPEQLWSHPQLLCRAAQTET